jgi:hypothetical protein
MCLHFPTGNPDTNSHLYAANIGYGEPLQAEPRTPYGVYFVFKDRSHWLRYGIGVGKGTFGQPSRTTTAQLDTLSNWHSRERMYVEIIRQDDPLQPTLGMALGFEFDESQLHVLRLFTDVLQGLLNHFFVHPVRSILCRI